MRLRELVCVSVGFVVLTLLFMAPLLPELATGLPASVRDPHLNAWVLAWGADRLPHGLRGFWNPPIFYPYPNALAYNENLLGITVLVAPVYWLSHNPTLVYNVAFLLSFVITAVGAYLLAHELTGRTDAALVAACAFAFAPYRWAQLPHLQVLSVGWLPVALWALHRIFRSPSWTVIVTFAIASLLHVFSNGYSAYQAALAIILVGSWCAARYGVTRAQLVQIGAAAGVIGLLLAPSVLAHLDVWSRGRPVSGDFVRYSADLGSYLDVPPGLPLANWLPGVAQNEGRLFPGAIVALMALVAFAPLALKLTPNPWRWLYGGIALLAIVISLGPEPQAWGHRLPIPGVYGWLVASVPLFSALRVPARFGMLALLAFSALAAMGAARIMATLSRRQAIAATGVLCAVILWEGYGGPLVVQDAGFTGSAEGDVAADAWLAGQPPGVVLNLPISTLGRRRFRMQHQYATLQHHHRIVGGISRAETPLQAFLGGSASPLANPDLMSDAVAFLRGLGVRYVIFRPGHFLSAPVAERLGDTLERSEGSRRVARFTDVVAYEIALAPEPDKAITSLADRPAAGIRLTASHQTDRLALATDGDPRTRWISGHPQNGTEWIALDFARPRDVARVDFVLSPRSVGDYPREIEIVAAGLKGEARLLYHGRILESLGRGWARSPDLPVASIDLPMHSSTRLVVRQLGRAQPWFWSVDELVVWERQ